jgi:hypothetical protein
MENEELGASPAWGLCQSCMMVSEGWNTLSGAATTCPRCGESAFGVEWPPEPAGLLLRQAFAVRRSAETPPDIPPEPPQVGTLGGFRQLDNFTELPKGSSLGEDLSQGLLAHEQAFEERGDGRDLAAQEEAERAAVQAFLVTTALDVTLEWVFKAAVESLDPDSLEVARLVEPRQESTLTTQERLDLLSEVTGFKLREISETVDEPQFPGWWKELDSKRDRFLHNPDILAFRGITKDELLEFARMGVKVLATLNNSLW